MKKILFVLCVLSIMSVVGCGTTFTAGATQKSILSLLAPTPKHLGGQALFKIDTKTACTINPAKEHPLNIQIPCVDGQVQWYAGITAVCIPDPCTTGTLTHMPNGTVSCQ